MSDGTEIVFDKKHELGAENRPMCQERMHAQHGNKGNRRIKGETNWV